MCLGRDDTEELFGVIPDRKMTDFEETKEMMLKKHAFTAVVGASIALASAGAFAQEKLVVWFTKGFYPAEDAALATMVYRFEQKTNVKVELSTYAVQDIIPKSVAALDSGSPPDLAFGHTFDFQVAGKWAAEGKLLDLSDMLVPIKDKFLGNTLSTALFTGPNGKKAYYATPVYQQTIHVQVWKDMLEEAGFKESDIPKGWNDYWNFWCDKVQPAHRAKTGKRTYAIGQPLGVDSTDTFFSFHQFMLAYNVQLVDENGKLLVDDPKNKAGIAKALKDYTNIMARGCTPPSSISWKDPDNNVNFHNKTTVMTHNATISIASKWLDDMNNQTLTADQRATAKRNYEDQILTLGWPNKPDGKPMNYLAAVKLAVAFQQGKNQKRAKEFLAFMMEDANLLPYTEGALGRWFPVTKAGAERDFWTKQDKHRMIVTAQFKAGTGTFPFTRNYKFSILNNENVWGKAMSRVINDKWDVNKATDEMVARIKTVAGDLK
jgi:multiple sugar transport system substrate-binding protein